MAAIVFGSNQVRELRYLSARAQRLVLLVTVKNVETRLINIVRVANEPRDGELQVPRQGKQSPSLIR